MPHRPPAGGGGDGLLHTPHSLSDGAFGADLDQTGVAVLDELGVVPTGGGGGADREVEGTQHREYWVGQIGGSHAAFEVVQHPSIVRHRARTTGEPGARVATERIARHAVIMC